MSFQLKPNNPFSGHGILKSQSESHSFVCQNARMASVNLSVFTTSSLEKWLSYKKNKEILKYTSEEEIDDLVEDIVNNQDQTANISVWRKEGRNGRYVEFVNLSEWKYDKSETDVNLKYAWSDVINNETDAGYSPTKNIIIYLIKLNDFIQEKIATDPVPDLEFGWTKQQIAAYEFFIDVNSSKERCLSWTNNLDFIKESISVDDRGKTELEKEYEQKEITIKLYFFSLFNNKKTERKVGTKELNIVAPRKDCAGKEYIAKDEGKTYYATTQDNPKSHAGAPLDLKYTEFLNRWESGTPQAIAIMTTDLPPAERPDLETFINGAASDSLHHETGLQVIAGSAMPVSMDKCNPLQWCPTYSRDERDREELQKLGTSDKSKVQVPVYNLSPSAFSSGDIVILNRIDGVWIPIPYASGDLVTKKSTSLGKWDFTYLMTNTDYYFRNKLDELITYQDFEKGLYKSYYINDPLNKNYYTENDEVVKYADVSNSYFQVTSWDFMGEKIGGLRTNGHALACNQFEFHPDNSRVNDSNNGRESLGISGPFFGCVFPNGYEETGKVEILKANSKNFIIKPTGAQDKLNRYHEFFEEIPNDQNVFENDNTNALSSAKEGIFAHDNITQLPADIAVNCSPEGQYGRPISLVRTLPTGNQNLQNEFKEYFKYIPDSDLKIPRRYAWLYQHPVGDDPVTTSDVNNSAFDIRPTNIRKIQFRPLKTETYACFEIDSKSDATVGSEERGEFARRMWDSQDVDENPIATGCLTRNTMGGNDLYHGKGVGLIYENSIDNARPRSDNNPDLLWLRNWIEFGDGKTDNAGGFPMGNAFGIIGAVCTVSFNDKIEFVLDNYIGMTPWFLNGALYPSWGAGNYNSAHTTQLWARCFHSWPREQTIYDSRFFAVHHFNEGVERQDPLDPNDAEQVAVSGKILDVDFLEITSPSINSKVHADTTEFASGVTTRRRGKLLPYKWEYKTLGVGPFSYFLDPERDPPEKAQNVNIFIKASGENYNENDRFIVNGGNGEGVLLKPVVSIENGGITSLQVVHSGYNFLQSDFLAKGTDLTPSTTSSLSVGPSGSVAGNGLEAIIVGGTVVNSPVFTDKKPKEIFVDQITPSVQQNAGVNTITDGASDKNRAFGQDLSDSDRSDSGEYDLFLHFHNDISHTWDFDRALTPPAYEQKLDLTINLDPDS